MENERTVIHLEINGEHHYYGSIARMYEDYSGDELGITYASLRNYKLSSEHPYQNKKSVSFVRENCYLKVAIVVFVNNKNESYYTNYGFISCKIGNKMQIIIK